MVLHRYFSNDSTARGDGGSFVEVWVDGKSCILVFGEVDDKGIVKQWAHSEPCAMPFI
jgi:hypothetical protein